MGLGHSSSRPTGLAKSNPEYEAAWEFGILRGQERNEVLWIEFRSVRDFINSHSKGEKELPVMQCTLSLQGGRHTHSHAFGNDTT